MKEQRKADIAKAVSLDYNEIKFYYRQGMRGIMINKIAVYSRSFYQEISLPTVSEQSTSFRIEKELHRLQENLTIHMEELDHCWCFSQSGQYQIFKGKELFFQRKADPGDILRLYSPSNEEILLVVGEQSREKESLVFRPGDQYIVQRRFFGFIWLLYTENGSR